MSDKCKRCDSDKLTFIKDSLQFNPETDQEDLVSGFVCDDCNCFHAEDGSFFQYDINERRIEVKFIKQSNDRSE